MRIFVLFSMSVLILLSDNVHCRATSSPKSEEDSVSQEEVKDVEYSDEEATTSLYESATLSKSNKDKSDEDTPSSNLYEDATPSYSNPKEDTNARVITDPEIIYGSHGAPIQFLYNETNSNESGDLRSAPGCPKSINGTPWIYYGKPRRCHLAWVTGPCKLGEKLIPRRNSLSGICGCECLADVENIHLLKQHSGRFFFCKNEDSEAAPNGQIYDKKNRKCFPTFKLGSGRCRKGDVISKWTEDSITCLPFCHPANSTDNWKKEEAGICTTGPGQTFVQQTLVHDIDIQDECKENQIYSKSLKTCIVSSKRKFALS